MKINKPKFKGIHKYKECKEFIENNNTNEDILRWIMMDSITYGVSSFKLDRVMLLKYRKYCYLQYPFFILTDEHKIYEKLKLHKKVKFVPKIK